MDAYETYLKGLYFFNQWGEASGKAIPYFKKAIELQDDFALAHARLGVCYFFHGFGGEMTWGEVHKKAKFHINKTIELKAETPEVFFAQFVLHVFINWDWKSAVETTKKGLELFPNYASLHHSLSTLYWIKGDQRATEKAHIKGLQLDPLSIEMNLYMGAIYLWGKDYEQATHFFDKVLEMVPNHRATLEYKGWTATFQQRYEEAFAIFDKLPPVGYRLHRSTCLGWIYYKQGNKEKAEEYLQELKNLEEHSPDGAGLAVDLATLYTCFNDFDSAFYYLEKAIKNRIGSIMMCKADPFLAPLENDPRFKKIEALIGEVPPIDF